MMLTLVRHDRVWRRFPKWLFLTLVNVLLVSGVRTGLHYRAVRAGEEPGDLGLILLLAAVWLPLGALLAYAGTLPRASQLALALPLRARRIWLAHMAALLLACGAVLVGAAGMAILHDAGYRAWLAPEGADPPHRLIASLLAVLPHLLAATVLTAVALLAWRPSLHRLEPRPGYVLATAGIVLGMFGLLLLCVDRSPGWALAALLAAGLLAAVVAAKLPPSLRLAPDGRGSGEPHAAALAHAAQPGCVPHSPAWWLLARIVLADPKVLLMLPFFLIFGFFLSGLIPALENETDGSLINLPISWYLLVATMPGSARRLPLVDPLPVSRRGLLLLLAATPLGLLFLGYLGGALAAERVRAGHEQILLQDEETHHAVRIPLESFAVAWDGRVPELVAPWGERHEPKTIQPWSGSRIVLYKPYTTPDGCSRSWLAWQLSRAVAGIYGEHLAPEEIDARYLVTGSSGATLPRDGALAFREDHPSWRPRGNLTAAPLVAVLVGVPGLLAAALVMAWLGRLAGPWRRRVGIVVAMVSLFGVQATEIGLAVADLWRPSVSCALIKIAARDLAGGMPGGVPVLWAGAALLLVGAWLTAERSFRRLEIAPVRSEENES